MKRAAAIGILMIMLANGAGFYFYYALQLSQIKREMRESLKRTPLHELEVLKLSKNEYEKARVEEHEVLVHGNMYDIAQIVMSEDMVLVYCKQDKEEGDLVELVKEVVGKPLKHKPSMPSQVISFLTLVYVIPSFHIHLSGNSAITIGNCNWSFALKACDQFLESPPPEV